MSTTKLVIDLEKSQELGEKFLKWATEANDNPHDYFNDDEWRIIMQVYRVLIGNEEL